MTAPALLIDASIYIFRYYFALPDNWFSEDEGWPTAAVYGYTAFLLRLLKAERPKRIAVCFDESLTTCFRNDIYLDYKSSRGLPDEGVSFQLSACRQVTNLLGIQTYGSSRYEADDLLASLYQQLKRSKNPIAVLTRDKDLGQVLVRDQDFLWDYLAEPKKTADKKSASVRGNIEAKVIARAKVITGAKVSAEAKELSGARSYPQNIHDKFGVWPHQLVDYLALVGDSIDDIPGVPGVGKQTAQQLLSHFNSLDDLFDQSHDIAILPIRGALKLSAKLHEYREQIEMAQQLARLVSDLKLINSVSDLNWKTPDWHGLERFANAMGFPRLKATFNHLRAEGV